MVCRPQHNSWVSTTFENITEGFVTKPLFARVLEIHKIYWKLLGKGGADLNDLYYTLDNLMKEHIAQGLGKKVSARWL